MVWVGLCVYEAQLPLAIDGVGAPTIPDEQSLQYS